MSKQSLILLHGWNKKPNYFGSIKPLLETKYKIFSPTMPGFGDIEIRTTYDLNKYADWLRDFITKNKIINPIILGHSFGGSVAVKYLSNYPNKKIKLILVCAAIVKDKYSIRKSLYSFFIHFFKPNINSPVMEETFKNVVYSDLLKEINKLDNKTLIIWGKRDLITPLSFGKKIKKHTKNSVIKIIQNSGHFPFDDNPSKFIFHVNKFLNEK